VCEANFEFAWDPVDPPCYCPYCGKELYYEGKEYGTEYEQTH